jgi:hypothetical protein
MVAELQAGQISGALIIEVPWACDLGPEFYRQWAVTAFI